MIRMNFISMIKCRLEASFVFKPQQIGKATICYTYRIVSGLKIMNFGWAKVRFVFGHNVG